MGPLAASGSGDTWALEAALAVVFPRASPLPAGAATTPDSKPPLGTLLLRRKSPAQRDSLPPELETESLAPEPGPGAGEGSGEGFGVVGLEFGAEAGAWLQDLEADRGLGIPAGVRDAGEGRGTKGGEGVAGEGDVERRAGGAAGGDRKGFEDWLALRRGS